MAGLRDAPGSRVVLLGQDTHIHRRLRPREPGRHPVGAPGRERGRIPRSVIIGPRLAMRRRRISGRRLTGPGFTGPGFTGPCFTGHGFIRPRVIRGSRVIGPCRRVRPWLVICPCPLIGRCQPTGWRLSACWRDRPRGAVATAQRRGGSSHGSIPATGRQFTPRRPLHGGHLSRDPGADILDGPASGPRLLPGPQTGVLMAVEQRSEDLGLAGIHPEHDARAAPGLPDRVSDVARHRWHRLHRQAVPDTPALPCPL